MIREPLATDLALRPQAVHRRRWVLGSLAVLGAAGAAWWGWMRLDVSVDAQALRIAEVRRGDLVRDAQVTGRAVAAVSPTLHAPAAGTVTLAVQAGDEVRVGQVLARVDSPALAAERAREQATLLQLEADQGRLRIGADKQRLAAERDADEARLALQAATRDEQRIREACAQGVVPQVDCLRAQDAVQAARIRNAHAARQAALEQDSAGFERQSLAQRMLSQRVVVAELERRLAALQVRSPVDGRVGSIAVADRAAVDTALPLITVVDLTRLEVELQVPESSAAALSVGLTVELQFGATRAIGVLAAIVPEVRAGQVQVRVRFEGAQPAGLRQHQRVDARILIDERPGVLMLPRGSFVEALGGHQAYVMDGDHAQLRPVRLGVLSVAAVEVTGGLQAGDRVVISGTERFDGAPRVRVRF
jgi:HlyD family secretion protein